MVSKGLADPSTCTSQPLDPSQGGPRLRLSILRGLGWVYPPPFLTRAVSTRLSLAKPSDNNLARDGHGLGKWYSARAAASASNGFSAGPEKEAEATSLPGQVPPDGSQLLVSMSHTVPACLGEADRCWQEKIVQKRKCGF